MLFEKGLASATHEAFYQPGLLLVVFAVTVLSAGFHEFGHAAAARYGGATPGAMGAGLYLVWPAFYTDVTDSYRLGRGGRVRTDLGGLYFNAIVAVAMFGVWWRHRLGRACCSSSPPRCCRWSGSSRRWSASTATTCSPTSPACPTCTTTSSRPCSGSCPQNWRKPERRCSSRGPARWSRAWVLLVVPAARWPPGRDGGRVPARGRHRLGQHRRPVGDAPGRFGDGDVARAWRRGCCRSWRSRCPSFGIGLHRRPAGAAASPARVWRRHRRASPARRALAGRRGAGRRSRAWPGPGGPRTTATGRSSPTSAARSLDALPLSAAPAGLAARRVARAGDAVAERASRCPPPSEPALAVVLVPRAEARPRRPSRRRRGAPGRRRPRGRRRRAPPTPTWVFPFNRPPAPGEGDNQALAVNTEDGSTVYDVAFALVWADGDTADNVNSAYALASCRDCTTVAVGLPGGARRRPGRHVVPQNLAAAVNYSCVSCVTAALAQQLVLTLEGPLSDLAMEELAALWQEIAEYGATSRGCPLGEIHAQLTAYEERSSRSSSATRAARPEPDGGPASASPTPSGTAGPRRPRGRRGPHDVPETGRRRLGRTPTRTPSRPPGSRAPPRQRAEHRADPGRGAGADADRGGHRAGGGDCRGGARADPHRGAHPDDLHVTVGVAAPAPVTKAVRSAF